MAAISSRYVSRRRVITRWVIVGIVVLLLFVALWVTVRALIARDQLLGAEPLARNLSSAALGGDRSKVDVDEAQLQNRAATAASLTSDPIWRATEILPYVGGSLTAFRQSAAMIKGVADNALPPIDQLSHAFTADSFTPKNGTVNLTPFVKAAPALQKARVALDLAGKQAAAIDTANTLPQVGSGVSQLISLVDEAKGSIDSLATASSLLPPMLGNDGPRSYLLLSFNNAELRATGGISGALAVINVDHGTITLGQTASDGIVHELPQPILPLTKPEQTLYQNILGTYIQDVNLTPDFARSGALAQTMWKRVTGQTVDGVVSIDPVALSYILQATGPVSIGDGQTLTSGNAVQTLLSTVYSTFSVPAQQDAFFAGVTGKVFSAATSSGVNGRSLFSAIVRAANEGRIHVWSAHPAEQAQLAGSTIATALPHSTRSTSGFGVYFDDGTGAKMGYYLRSGISITGGLCRPDGRPTFDVRVRLISTAPTDAATSLPEYVTGGGDFGVPPGTVQTSVYVYAPAGAYAYGVAIDGAQNAFVAAEHDGHSVAGVSVSLRPGQSSTAEFQFLGKAGDPVPQTIVHTPMSTSVSTSVDNDLTCPTAQPTPVPSSVNGALGRSGFGSTFAASVASSVATKNH
jgi:hypothetical protein